MERNFLKDIISEIREEGWKVLVIEIEGSPFELEEELKKEFEERVVHFWSPGSKIGVISVEGRCQVYWLLGKENKVLRREMGGSSSEAIEGISSSTISDPFIIAFKERYREGIRSFQIGTLEAFQDLIRSSFKRDREKEISKKLL